MWDFKQYLKDRLQAMAADLSSLVVEKADAKANATVEKARIEAELLTAGLKRDIDINRMEGSFGKRETVLRANALDNERAINEEFDAKRTKLAEDFQAKKDAMMEEQNNTMTKLEHLHHAKESELLALTAQIETTKRLEESFSAEKGALKAIMMVETENRHKAELAAKQAVIDSKDAVIATRVDEVISLKEQLAAARTYTEKLIETIKEVGGKDAVVNVLPTSCTVKCGESVK